MVEKMAPMKRMVDIVVASVGLVVLSVPLLVVALLVKLTSKGPVLYWSKRVGKDNRSFRMPKFRTMRVETPAVASHLLRDPARYVTLIGRVLRMKSVDELPQLWCVLIGDMSVVGPRPALFNQDDLIGLRTEAGVHRLVPGLTGWAQVSGRDDLSIPDKVELDTAYLHRRSLAFDLKIIALTFMRVLKSDGVDH
jgi:O-antigen biosynthesis protein WbqP